MADNIEHRIGNELLLQKIEHLGKTIDIRLVEISGNIVKLADYQKEQNVRVTQLEITNGGRDVRIANLGDHVKKLESKSNLTDALIGAGSLIAAAIAGIYGGTK